MSGPTFPQTLALAAALRWWESHRPSGWTTQQHCDSPYVGLSANIVDRALAKACADLIIANQH